MKKLITTFGPAVVITAFIALTARHLDAGEYGSAFITGAIVLAGMLWAVSYDIVKAIKETKKP